jgi:hypothetical protein
MIVNLDIFSISSVAYRTAITDGGLLKNIIKKENFAHVKKQSKNFQIEIDNETSGSTGRRFPRRNQASSRKTEAIWTDRTQYRDTSGHYRRPYMHLGLRSRILRNSGGSLPKEISFLTRHEIESNDSSTIKSYLTPSRSIRKCCLTVFTACATMAARSIGIFKNCSERAYSCKSITPAVHELAKGTHAGTDTLGKKNDKDVQNRVISQLRDLLKNPTSYRLISKNPSFLLDSGLDHLLLLPELIFHRFQAVYDDVSDICVEKSRLVWCVPFTVVALENIFFGKLIDSTKSKSKDSNESIYPISLTNYQTGQRSVSTLRNKFKILGNKNFKIYSLDFKKFDSTIPNWTKDMFFSIMRTCIDMTPKQSKVYDFLRFYVKYTPFVSKEGVRFKEKGISSGLLITNLFDTWFNLTLFYFVDVLKLLYPESIDSIYDEEIPFDRLFMDKSKVKYSFVMREPFVRVMGDDSIFLCDEFTLELHRKICKLLGMEVTVKHVTSHPDDDIFFLGRYWNSSNRPFQTKEYMALRIIYTKWYDDKLIPFDLKDLHLNRILSICLPLIGGKEFLDKYLFDYEPYIEFKNSDYGFIYMKDFIEDNFRYTEKTKAYNVDNY